MPSDPRLIPSIEQLRQRGAVQRLETRYGREATVQALREEAAALRRQLAADEVEVRDAADAAERIEAHLAPRLDAALSPSLRPVINASGVIVHTNLGRAPLSPAAIDRVAAVARGYTNLEYDLAAGRRGSRAVHASTLLARLTGAEDAVVVNNNAAAVLLTLAALAAGREVVISRGELVEIGGGFRVPDVLRQSGALLREVGTTNRTRAADYAAAIGDRTAILLRVHPSNFRIEGFTERPTLAEIVSLGERSRIPVVEDLGSGCLNAIAGIDAEPTVRESIAAGVAVCTFSGDKLLGGPQAGVIAGRRAELDRVRSHPLMRALRVDKLAYAALEATLIDHATGRAGDTVPVVRMIETPLDDLEARAEALGARLADAQGLAVSIAATEATVGGGSTPGVTLRSRALAVEVPGCSATALAALLRTGIPPVIGRIIDDRLLLDLRTVHATEDDDLADAILRASRATQAAD